MNSKSHAESGFTLVELLVSLAILAVALGVLFTAISGALDRARESRNEMVATSLVQSLLARAGTERPLQSGTESGAYSNGFRWRVRVSPYGDDDDRKAWQALAYVVEASVSWQQGNETLTRRLTTLRVVPPEKAS
jgi:general secretion pathway protein I